MSGRRVSREGCCVHCGTQAPIGALFCPHCGEPFDPSCVYDESISSDEAVAEDVDNLLLGEIIRTPRPQVLRETGTQVLYEGTIRGFVTKESGIIRAPVVGASKSGVGVSNPYYGIVEAQFVIKLEEDFEGAPDEILVHTFKFGYFGKGDKVILQGIIIKINLEKWNRPMYLILADHFYNESLQIGDEGLMGEKQVLHQGVIRGRVTRDSITRIAKPYHGYYISDEVFFTMKLEEGFEGVPNEILVRSDKRGYFRQGDRVILQGTIIKVDLRQWNRPMYNIIADRFYNESLQFGDEKLKTGKQLYKGIIRGSVTGESGLIQTPVGGDPIMDAPIPYSVGRTPRRGFAEAHFSMKLKENIVGAPDEILVYTKFGYFGTGDKVILRGTIFEKYLIQWGKPMYTILADHFYNESLRIGDERLMAGKRVLYQGMIRGSVTKESKTRIDKYGKFAGTYFAIKLEENIGIKGIPDEILVRLSTAGYFGIGDEVTLPGRILKTHLKKWNRPMYIIRADHFYNESLQIGDGVFY